MPRPVPRLSLLSAANRAGHSTLALGYCAYSTLCAPLWQWPAFFVLFCAGVTSLGSRSDGSAPAGGRNRLLPVLVLWEHDADPDPDPFKVTDPRSTQRRLTKLKGILTTIQVELGRFCSFMERCHYIFSWSDSFVSTLACAAVFVVTCVLCVTLRMLFAAAQLIGGRPLCFLFVLAHFTPHMDGKAASRRTARVRTLGAAEAGEAENEIDADSREGALEPEAQPEAEQAEAEDVVDESTLRGALRGFWSRVPDTPAVAHREICALQRQYGAPQCTAHDTQRRIRSLFYCFN